MAYEKHKSETYLLGGRNTKASIYKTGILEFREIVNMNFAIHGALSQRLGSALYSGATVTGKITGAIEYQRLNGASYLVVTANTTAYTVTTSAFTAFKSSMLNNALFSFQTVTDRLFAANGNDFFRFDGTNTYNYGLPPGSTAAFTVSATVGGSLTPGITGVFVASYGYFNERGYFGPIAPGMTVVVNGITTNSITYNGMTSPSDYGISGILLYRTSNGGALLTGTTTFDASTVTALDPGFPLSTRIAPLTTQFTLIPRYLELFNNQMFLAGFSGFLSTAYWSNIGEPEGIEPQNFAEFRTNDGDKITGMKSYGGQLIVSKERSLHRVTGTNPNNFLINELTDQYGCLSHRAMVVFENRFWCLDTKGIVEFNGANLVVVSVRVEDIFATMNISAAREQACAIHYRQGNEVWFAIPTGTSTVNDTIVVYDYVADQWTVYKGITPSVLFVAKQTQQIRLPFFGGYSGSISYMSPTLTNDNGRGITCSIKTRFDSPRGQSTEDMFRRLYLDINPILSATLPITVNLMTNYSPTIQITRTMYRNPFQSRIDFGLSARAIQGEMIHSSASFPITIFGYTWESRFQRGV